MFAYLKRFLSDRPRKTPAPHFLSTDHLTNLRLAANAISFEALTAVDAVHLIERAITVSEEQVSILQTNLKDYSDVYVITLGKAGFSTALGLHYKIGHLITQGICISDRTRHPINYNWRMFAGGHPVPNDQSLLGAEACFELLEKANNEKALIIFVVSGGGSAMLEWPVNSEISLRDLQEANRVLVTCGASINEINVVRRAFSAVKGGKLAARALNARIVTLIISDTNPGDDASVASGPTLPPPNLLSAFEVVRKHQLDSKLPETILRAIAAPQADALPHPNSTHDVLADNRTAIAGAVSAAKSIGFKVIVAEDISEQEIAAGCAELLARLDEEEPPVCLLSGGEFSCVVRGEGRGGRNLETVLRLAMQIDQRDEHIVVLSEATDGMDGNSRVARAVADNRTMARARAKGLDAADFLARSDSFNFFEALGDTFGQGPTQTNVRDIRILLKTARDNQDGLNLSALNAC